MEQLAKEFDNPWTVFIFMALGGVITQIVRSFISKYTETRAQHVAEGVNLPEQLYRSFLDQTAKSSAARLDMERAEHCMKILGLMSEIESLLFSWKFTVFFHSDELEENQTVEDLGIKDLKRVAQLNMELLKSANAASVLIGDEIPIFVSEWSAKVREVLYDYHAAYVTSKSIHEGKLAMDGERVNTISQISESEIYPKMKNIGGLKIKVKDLIRNAAKFS